MKAVFAAVATLAATFSVPVGAVTAGQIDTFDAGLAGWFAGGGPLGGVPPVPPQVIAGGGPAGAADAYMLVTAVAGGGPGGRVVAMNASQWAGNYLAAGVNSIAMDLRNFGATDLTIRLLFENPILGPPADIAATTFGALLPAGSDWMHFEFPITPADFTVLAGDIGALLAGTTLIRLFNGATPAFPGDIEAGLLGVDNIVAAVPEPAALASLLVGLGVLGVFGRRRRMRRDR